MDVSLASLPGKRQETIDGNLFMYLESGQRIEPTDWQRKIASILEIQWGATIEQFLWKHGHTYVSPGDILTDWGIASTQHRLELIDAEWNLWLKIFEIRGVRKQLREYPSHFEGFRLSLLEWKIEEFYYTCGNADSHRQQQEVWRTFVRKLEDEINPFGEVESMQRKHRFNLIQSCLVLQNKYKNDNCFRGVSNLSVSESEQLKDFIFKAWIPYKAAVKNYLKISRSGYSYRC